MPDALSCSGFQDPNVLHLPGDWASIRDSGELRTAIIQGVQPPRLFLKLPRQILFFASPPSLLQSPQRVLISLSTSRDLPIP